MQNKKGTMSLNFCMNTYIACIIHVCIISGPTGLRSTAQDKAHADLEAILVGELAELVARHQQVYLYP